MEQQENTTPSLEQQLQEAEERGYRRGLNEQIESKMREPGVWEAPGEALAEEEQGYEILANHRKSIWE